MTNAQRAAVALYKDTALAAEADHRPFTDDERAELRAALDESGAKFSRGRPTPGEQFVRAEAFDFFRRGEHKRAAGVWTSPVIEVSAPPPLHATTLTTAGLTFGQVEPVRPYPTRVPTVASLMAQGRTSANAILYPYETAPPANLKTGATAEGAAKGALAIGTFGTWTAPVVKTAGIVPISEEKFDDVPALAAYIDSRVMRAADLAVDADLIAQIAALPGITPPYALATQSNASALLAQAVKVFNNSGYIPDAIVMHPNALWGTLTIAGQELVGADLADDAGVKSLAEIYLYGMRLLPTPAAPTPGTAIVGAFADAAQIFWRDEFAVEVTNSHLDNFTTNLLMMRGERRYALAVYFQAAFGAVTGLTVLT